MYKQIVLGSAIFLTACVGGDSDNEGGGGVPSESDFVTGAFKDAAIEGKSFLQNMLYAGGSNGHACAGETHYFETGDGRVRVYGSTAFSETDFRVVSTMIHSRLDGVLDEFGLTWEVFVDQRPYFTLDHLASLAGHYRYDVEYGFGDDPGTGSDDPHNDASSAEVKDWALWSSLTVDEQLEFAEYFASLPISDEANEDMLLPREALVACLSPEMSGAQFGEGTQLGINVPPNTSSYNSRVGEIFTHEVVHFIQSNISHVGQSNPFTVMPRWFTEGQAVYLAGQSLASVDHHYNHDPVDILTWDDERESGYDTGMAYEHYGLAYQYIHENNGAALVVEMMMAMKSNTDSPQVWQPSAYGEFGNGVEDDPGLAFVKAFADHLTDHTGAALEYNRYRSDYHDLMNNWAN